MYSYLKSLYTDITLPVKGIVLGLLIGLLTWLVLDYFLARSLDKMLLQREREQLQQKAVSNRLLFHQYLTQHVRLTKLIATHQPLVMWLQQRRESAQTFEISRYAKHPPWFPPVSTWRGLLLNRGGETFIWSSVEDISETHTAQRALQGSKSRFALFMDHLPAAVFIKDSNSRVLYVN